MITKAEAQQLLDDAGTARTRAGDNLGPVLRIFLDEYTDWPSFATIHSLTPARETYVALHEADLVNGDLVVPYAMDRIHNAPQVDHDCDLSILEEDQLFDYYDVPLEGVIPSVAHLGTALSTDAHGNITETDVNH